MTSAARLHQALAAVCPILGVAIQAEGSGSFQADPSATAAQRSAAQSALASFDWSAAAEQNWIVQQQRDAATTNLGTAAAGVDQSELVILRALVMVLVDQLNVLRAAVSPPLSAITYAQAKSAIAAKINAGSADQ